MTNADPLFMLLCGLAAGTAIGFVIAAVLFAACAKASGSARRAAMTERPHHGARWKRDLGPGRSRKNPTPPPDGPPPISQITPATAPVTPLNAPPMREDG